MQVPMVRCLLCILVFMAICNAVAEAINCSAIKGLFVYFVVHCTVICMPIWDSTISLMHEEKFINIVSSNKYLWYMQSYAIKHHKFAL